MTAADGSNGEWPICPFIAAQQLLSTTMPNTAWLHAATEVGRILIRQSLKCLAESRLVSLSLALMVGPCNPCHFIFWHPIKEHQSKHIFRLAECCPEQLRWPEVSHAAWDWELTKCVALFAVYSVLSLTSWVGSHCYPSVINCANEDTEDINI